jgi:hypothetical protein
LSTLFATVYNRFLGKVTDDMYIELTPADTLRDLQNLLIDALPGFEFPRKNLNTYTIDVVEVPEEEITPNDFVIGAVWGDIIDENSSGSNKVLVDRSSFNVELTSEEINILAILMKMGWVQRQVTSIEHTRMKYSGPDFKMTS